MKVLELLDEIVEIVDTSSEVPLTGKILVDAEEILEIVKEIRVELPDEIQQAQWIKEERQKILEEARKEYEKIVADAKDQAATMIDTNEITVAPVPIDRLQTACTHAPLALLEYPC